MVYKYTSSKEVIAKVFTDLDLQESPTRIADMQEWIGEGLDKIGAFPQYIPKIAGKGGRPVLELENYQTTLPADFYKLIQIGYGASEEGPFIPMRYATGSFDYDRRLTADVTPAPNNVAPDSQLIALTMALFDYSYAEAATKINTDVALRQLLTSMVSSTDVVASLEGVTNFTTDLTFVINNNYIKTNIETGKLMLAYLAVPVDDDGYPLVPDNESFKEALYWYVNMKVSYPEWAQGRMRDAVYYHMEHKWNFYRKQAYAEAMMPDAEMLETIKNTWLKLMPDNNAHDTFFSNLGQQQHVYTHTNRGRR